MFCTNDACTSVVLLRCILCFGVFANAQCLFPFLFLKIFFPDPVT